MRFAGSKVEDFLSGRPNMGKLSQQGAIVNSNEIAAGTEAQGMVAASGVAAQAKAKEAENAKIEAEALANRAVIEADGRLRVAEKEAEAHLAKERAKARARARQRQRQSSTDHQPLLCRYLSCLGPQEGLRRSLRPVG